MSLKSRARAGGTRMRVDFCDSCAKVTDDRRRRDDIIDGARMQALRLSGGLFR